MEYISTPIQPFQYKSGIPEIIQEINTLGVFNYTDDLKGNCIINWFLSNGSQNILWDNYKLTQEEYNNWDSSATALLEIIAKYLNVSILK